jgi:hypothetical protein
MSRHRKRPTVMPKRASYGTACVCAGILTSEKPNGSPPRHDSKPGVWTARMLAALEKGVKGGKWYSLIDKVYPEAALRAALVQRNDVTLHAAQNITNPRSSIVGRAMVRSL